MTCSHEQAAATESAEADVGAALRQIDVTNRHAGRIENHHTVMALAPTPSAPKVAVDIDPQAVAAAALIEAEDDAAVCDPGAVVDDVLDGDDLWRRIILDDVELALVR